MGEVKGGWFPQGVRRGVAIQEEVHMVIAIAVGSIVAASIVVAGIWVGPHGRVQLIFIVLLLCSESALSQSVNKEEQEGKREDGGDS